MRCGVCRRVVRKTTLVNVPSNGGLRGARACAECMKLAVVIVPLGGVTPCACGRPATKCGICAHDAERKDARRMVQPFVERLRRLARAYPGERGEGIEQAADLIDSGEVVE